MGSGTNLVIQQVGDVTRMQEAMQKSAELQQHTAAQEQMRQEQMQRSQVQKGAQSASENRVNKDGRREQGKPSRDRNKNKDKDNSQPVSGGLLDIII